MKLSELNPKWAFPSSHWSASAGDFFTSLSFDCPHCRAEGKVHGQCRRLSVPFFPPIDPKGLAGTMFEWRKGSGFPAGELIWDRIEGDTFESLTLTPSLNFEAKGHWHGCISNGMIVP